MSQIRSPNVAQTPYTSGFYEDLATTSRTAAAAIVPVLVDLFRPRSVVDVGCGTGSWLAAFQRMGVPELRGYEGPWIESVDLEISDELVVSSDLSAGVRSDRTFDLVVSLEVGEHLAPTVSEMFTKSLTGLGSLIVFSAAIPKQGGTDHVNEQWPARWVDLFAANGYVVIDCLRPRFWANDAIAWWYSQNMLLFVAADDVPRYEHLEKGAFSPIGTATPLVHPRNYTGVHGALERALHRTNLSERWCSELAAALPHAIGRAVLTRLNRIIRTPLRHENVE